MPPPGCPLCNAAARARCASVLYKILRYFVKSLREPLRSACSAFDKIQILYNTPFRVRRSCDPSEVSRSRSFQNLRATLFDGRIAYASSIFARGVLAHGRAVRWARPYLFCRYAPRKNFFYAILYFAAGGLGDSPRIALMLTYNFRCTS